MFRDRTKARLEEVSMSIVGRALRRRDGGGGRARRNGNWAPKQFGWCGYLLLWGFSASACYPFSPTPPLRLRNPKVFPQILSQRVPCFVQTQRRTRGAQFLTLFVGWLSPESHRRLVTLDLRRPTQKIEMKPYTTAPTCHLSPESESSSLSRLNSQQLVRPHLAMHNHIGSSTAPQTATHKSARKQHSLNSGRGLPEEQREALASHEYSSNGSDVYASNIDDEILAAPRICSDDLSELHEWLGPLSEQMELKRENLLPHVLPGSRQWLVKSLFQLLSLDGDGPAAAYPSTLLWLNGVVGVGKSVVAAVFANALQSRGMLGSLFFWENDLVNRYSAHNLVSTLVFGLAKLSVQFGAILVQVKRDIPDILSRSASEIADALLVQPLRKLSAEKIGPVVFVVDGLDGCGAVDRRAEALHVLLGLSRLLPANVKILVTSRPDADIASAFQNQPAVTIEPFAVENVQDQISFAEHILKTCGADHDVVHEGSKILVARSDGVFVWLVHVCNYLSNLTTRTITVEKISGVSDFDILDGSLEAMYDRVFSALLHGAQLRDLESVLCSVLAVLTVSFEPLSEAGITGLLQRAEIGKGGIEKCLNLLQPIVVRDKLTGRIRLFHHSAKHYLMSQTMYNASSLHVATHQAHSELAALCIKVLQNTLKFNLCDLPFSAFHSEIPDFEQRVQRAVPEHVKYALVHFSEHLFDSFDAAAAAVTDGAAQSDLFGKLQVLMETHGHHLLEAASLANCLPMLIPALARLQSTISRWGRGVAELEGLNDLMEEMKFAVQKFHIPIESSALQVYFSAIPFSPSSSLFYNQFAGAVPHGVATPCMVKGQSETWPPILNVLEGHTDVVFCVSFSPDGQLVLSSSSDGTIRIWDAAAGWELHRLEGHTGLVSSASFSPDGKLIVSGGEDRTIRIWDVAIAKELRQLTEHDALVHSVAFSPDGHYVVVGGFSDQVRILSTSSGAVIHTLVQHKLPVSTVAFSPDGQSVICAVSGLGGIPTIWDVSTGQRLQTLDAGIRAFTFSATFSPDGEFAVSTGYDEYVRIWNSTSGQLLHRLKRDTVRGKAGPAAFSPDGQFLVCSNNGSLTIWDLSSMRESSRVEVVPFVHSVAFSPDGQSVVCACFDNTVKIWKPRASQLQQRQEGHSREITSVALSADNQFVASGSSDKTIRIWRATTGQELCKLEGHTRGVRSVAFSPDGHLVVSASDDKTARIWDRLTGREVLKLEGHRDSVVSATFSPDGQCVLSQSQDHSMRIWNASTGEILRQLLGHSDDISSAAYSADGNFVVSGSCDKTVRIWDALTGQELHKLVTDSKGVRSVAFSPQGELVGLVTSDGTVIIWNASTEQELIKLENLFEELTSGAFYEYRRMFPNYFSDHSAVWQLALEPAATENLAARHSFSLVRSASGKRLHSANEASSVAINHGVWFTENSSGVSSWIPPELRGSGSWQLLLDKSILLLGEGYSGFIHF